MPGEELLRFPAEDVLRHAGSTDAVADAVEQARSAVREVTMDPQAYGQLCQFLPGLLSPIFAEAASALTDTGESLRGTAHHLRAAAASITATDTTAGDSIRDAGRPSP
ncbi:type VII secretion target [Actinoplanes subglobosus]|uniref:Type VII secretion target n=1 Tax=Actinoplanes subglobosus TaxID=1547892 RepID=A0ABV8J6F5_9ACTN